MGQVVPAARTGVDAERRVRRGRRAGSAATIAARTIEVVLTVSNADIEIRPFVGDDLDAVVAFSLRAWAPVFTSVQDVLGDATFLRLHPDWKVGQAEVITSICTNDERDVFVAATGGRPVGFVAVALNAFHDRMGAIEIIGVDPDYQRQGIGERLTEHAVAYMQGRGMDIVVVETGGDPGHAPARALYAETGFSLLPISRYFRLLDERPAPASE